MGLGEYGNWFWVPRGCRFLSGLGFVVMVLGVQVPHIEGPWSQKPIRAWYLEPESFNNGYLDPPGPWVVALRPDVFE